LFAAEEETAMSMPELAPDHYLEDAYDQIELLGFPLVSPFALTDWQEENEIPALPAPQSKSQTPLLPAEREKI
jgi:hypothetical protein